VELGGFGKLHAPLLTERRTRGSLQCSVAGNPGPGLASMAILALSFLSQPGAGKLAARDDEEEGGASSVRGCWTGGVFPRPHSYYLSRPLARRRQIGAMSMKRSRPPAFGPIKSQSLQRPEPPRDRFLLTKERCGSRISRPSMSESQEVTMLLSALTKGEDGAASKLMPVVYAELRRLAGSYMRRERTDHTLQATALVHEAYLKLIEQRAVNWQSRAHFFGVAAQLMRRILIDYARGHTRDKRGGEQKKVSLDEVLLFSEQQSDKLLAVDDSLNLLEKIDARQARVVELRFFGGLSVEEAAEVLGVSPKTVKRDWSVAKAWLYADLKERYGIDPTAMGERQSAV
jgi:RNA polymerase sigma-70 factor, ECF subfamily